MSQKVLGLDIGSYSIKAALFDTTFRTYDLTDLFESAPMKLDDVDPADRAVIETEAILRLFQEHGIPAGTVVTALPGSLASTRLLNLPLSPRQVEKVLPFELEPNLPFDLEDLLIDHHLISGSKTSSLLLASAVRKSVVAERLAQLTGASIDPAFLTLDSLSLGNLCEFSLPGNSTAFGMIDIGHQKTSIVIVANGEIRFVRTLLTAGRSITEAIRENLNLTQEQAVEVKHTHGILELESQPLASADLRKLSTAIRKAIDPLFQEILQTLHAYRSQYTHFAPDTGPFETLYLCGGSSRLRNLSEYISAASGIRTELLPLLPIEHAAAHRLGDRGALFAQAVSLGLRAAARGAGAQRLSTLNFRKGPFAFARDLSGLKEKAFFFARWAAIIFILAMCHQGFRYVNLSRQHRKMEAQVFKIFKDIVPDNKKPMKKSADAMKIIQERVSEYRQKLEILTSGLNDMTALKVLREISVLIPPSIPIDTQELAIERNKITLRANTDSFPSVDQIALALKENKNFQNIARGDIRDSPDGKKNFQFIITVGEAEKPVAQKGKGSK